MVEGARTVGCRFRVVGSDGLTRGTDDWQTTEERLDRLERKAGRTEWERVGTER